MIGGYGSGRDQVFINKIIFLTISSFCNNRFFQYIIEITRLDDCQLKRVATLDFYFEHGVCQSYQFEVEKILFCFGSYPHEACYTLVEFVALI